MGEYWLPIKGYEGIYSVSNIGRVASLRRGLILKPALDGKGYYHVVLQTGTHKRTRKIHRLVAETFIPNPLDLPCVNHVNENKADNTVSNLEWCTNQYNSEYSNAGNYFFISPKGENVHIFNLNEFCKINNLTRSNMIKVLKGVRNHHKGWTCPSL